MSTSRLHELVPLGAIATEGANGSLVEPEDDDVRQSKLNSGYRLPPPEIRDIVDAPPVPTLSISPKRDKILFLKRSFLPPLSELAKSEDKLAGICIDGKSNTCSRMSFYTRIGIHDLKDDGTLGPEKLIHGLPDGSKFNFFVWSNDCKHLAFSIRQDQEDGGGSKLRVWVAYMETGKAKPLFHSPNVFLNAVFDNRVDCYWHPDKIAIGGHSYGAFMTANLLAYAPHLFSCGIACSGAYNRTLTPFGFQNEDRTLWEATETYIKMSPFMFANKIKKPILLIHGEEDNNTGTLKMQSDRFFNALKCHGALLRLVILPFESHCYSSRESIMHYLWETDRWLQKFCVSNSSEDIASKIDESIGTKRLCE